MENKVCAKVSYFGGQLNVLTIFLQHFPYILPVFPHFFPYFSIFLHFSNLSFGNGKLSVPPWAGNHGPYFWGQCADMLWSWEALEGPSAKGC